MKVVFFIASVFLLFSLSGCGSSRKSALNTAANFNYLAIGDSYTIGESVCTKCSFPEQLKDSLSLYSSQNIDLKIIAKTGWTTSDLQRAIANEDLKNNFDLVTLLIGVNNQYQNFPFTIYENQFVQLVDKAVELAKGQTSKVIVLSIPDYTFTPFGSNSSKAKAISEAINRYNTFAKKIANQKNVSFITITDLTRLGLEKPNLSARDGLHLSEKAYSQFVSRLIPKAIPQLKKIAL